MRKTKSLVKKLLLRYGIEVHLKQADKESHFSNLGEQDSIQRHIDKLRPENKICVDIAAGDGITMSNTYALFRDGWGGLAVEYDNNKFTNLAHAYAKFSGVNLAKCKVTPENIISLLEANQLPKRFAFLSLDIDGYDYFVLEQMLGSFRPSLMCVEINEKIPPPVKFTVKWDPDHFWREDHFFGQSVTQLHTLCTRFQYSLVELHYNNAFLIPSEISPYPALTPEEAYRTGYVERPDRKEKFPWNADVEALLSLPPEEAVAFINNYFSRYEGKYICSL